MPYMMEKFVSGKRILSEIVEVFRVLKIIFDLRLDLHVSNVYIVRVLHIRN